MTSYTSVHPLDHNSTPSHHAEALLSRARQLSSHAYERTIVHPPSTFAEGEDFNLSPATAKPPTSPFLSPTVSRESASLHQHHRSSFNDFINEHNRRRSHRLSTLSATSQSTIDSNNVAGSQSPSLSSVSTSLPTVSESTLIMQNNNNKQTSQDLTVEPFKGDSPTLRKHDDNKHSAQTASLSDCPTMTPIFHPISSPLSTFPRENSLQTNSSYLQPLPTEILSHRKHHSEIIKGEQHLIDFLGALRDDDKPLSNTVLQTNSTSLNISKRASQPSPSPFNQGNTYTPRTVYGSTTADSKQDQLKATRKSWVTTIPVSEVVSAPVILEVPSNQAQQINISAVSIQSANSSSTPTPTAVDITTAVSKARSISDVVPVTTTQSINASEKKLPSTPSSASTLQPPTAPKKEKRTSKIFGKLVPKFLHTSSGSTKAPSANARKSIESSSPILPSLPESIVSKDHDWHAMKNNMNLPSPSINSTASDSETPISPVSPINPAFAVSPRLSSSTLPTIMEPTVVLTESPEQVEEDGVSSFFRIEAEVSYEADEVQKQNENQSAFYGNDYSPYTINEDDDDFFLNSVLRKSRPLSTSTSPSMTIDSKSGRFSGRTPSLSTSFTSSRSSSATPSPTTSSPPSSLTSAPIAYYGMDEKRTRLSSAVKEWRRSTNQSTTSNYSMTYLGDSA